jgi:hypothetical protein
MPNTIRNAPVIVIATIAVICAVGVVRLVPQLGNSVWQDEAYTLLVYAKSGFWGPFTDYSLPNNHMLLSAVLSAYWQPADSVTTLRLLPGLSWLLTLGLMFVCGQRVVGRGGALLGLALLAGSSVAADFALALRGYPFSWPFALLMLLSATIFIRGGRTLALMVFLVTSLAALAILPTNIILSVMCICWVLLIGWREQLPRRQLVLRSLVLACAGFLGGLLYVPHLEHVLASAGWVDWRRGELLAHWFLATLGPYIWLLPIVAVGYFQRARQISSQARNGNSDLLVISVIGVTIVSIAVAPVVAFPRVLLPTLPLLYLAVGGALWHGLRVLSERVSSRLDLSLAVSALCVFSLGYLGPPCLGQRSTNARSADLCQQYYHEGYNPKKMLAALITDYQDSRLPVVLDAEPAWAFAFLLRNHDEVQPEMLDHRRWREVMGDELPRYVVTNSMLRSSEMLAAMQFLPATNWRMALDTGYFKLFERVASELP